MNGILKVNERVLIIKYHRMLFPKGKVIFDLMVRENWASVKKLIGFYSLDSESYNSYDLWGPSIVCFNFILDSLLYFSLFLPTFLNICFLF